MAKLNRLPKKTITLTVSGFFKNDLRELLVGCAPGMGVKLTYIEGKGFQTYPVTLKLAGMPSRVEAFLKVLRARRKKYHFTIDSESEYE